MRIAFFASHGGSNMQAILDAISVGNLHATPTLLICNNPDATAVKRAESFGMPVFIINNNTGANERERDNATVKILNDAAVDVIVLAGYMKKIGSQVLLAFSNRILNIHPALLPHFGGEGMYGMRVHSAVLAAGAKQSGPTVHLVNAEYDEGDILAQKAIPVLPDDTPESLAVRVLAEEHKIYWETLEKISEGTINL
ncbi:phosphoribosylglycinamide formyltransferase [bacterium]|nr:phosphoribosylglycinamide formyltransferase [bacterium]